MSAVSEKAKREEEKYLAERTTQWLEALTGQKLSALGLALGPLLKNGKVLARVASILNPSSARGSGSASFSKADLTEERKGFQAVLDVDLFLSCCRSLGLQDHQLFNASDVTTCGDLLRVCRTIRSLSLSCQDRGIEAPVFETGKQKSEARRRSMSTEATSTKVGDLQTKLGLDSVTESGRGHPLKGATAAIVGIAAGVATAIAFKILGPRTYVVRKGDTLTQVARRARGASLEGLVKKNKLADPNLIMTDQRIVL